MGGQNAARWCEVEHAGYVVAGQAAVRMRDGTETVMTAGDWFVIDPGHDSWVIGPADYESIHLVGASAYAAPEASSPRSVPGDQGPTSLSSRTLPAQAWGDGCAGWTLLDTPHLDVTEETMPAGTAEQPHRHSQVTQLYHMVEGTAVTHLGDGHAGLAAGTAVVIPPGSEHQLVNQGQSPNRSLVISSSPSRADRVDTALAGARPYSS